ncbi:DegT/DnrJ/EryC1/StrS family aminotransferase [Streptomyces sp. NPDC056831]|uniref:DegT/DnrJ/EryC1/StrS family aminotransferase n=1 Tax=Streptomyces sp. NPDC056831 TaxID=3345954 RepID=UPI003690C585
MYPNHRETAAAVLAGLREAHITTGAPHKLYTYALVGSGTPTGEIDAFDRELPPILEQHFAELTGRAGALVVASESSAFRLAMRGLGTGHDHEVAVPELGWVPGDIMFLHAWNEGIAGLLGIDATDLAPHALATSGRKSEWSKPLGRSGPRA